MSRPNWQVFLARELAARAGNTTYSHAVGALIVRGLVARNPQIDVAMQSFPQTDQTTQEMWVGADKPSVLNEALRKLWNTLDVPTSGGVSDKRLATALWQRAAVEYLTLPPQEHEAVAEIATRSKALGWYGASAIKDESGRITEGYTWNETGAGAWSGLRGFGGTTALRNDIATGTREPARTEFLRVYDKLVADSSFLREKIRLWQTDAASFGYYLGNVDGIWGPKSETAFLIMRPEAYNRPTMLADLITVESLGNDKTVDDRRVFEFGSVLASGVARDKWIATRPSNYPAAPTDSASAGSGSDDDGGSEVQFPEHGEPISTSTVTLLPVPTAANPNPEPIRVEITMPDGTGGEDVVITPIEEGVDDKKPVWPGVVAVVGGLGLLAAMVSVGSRKPTTP